MHLVGGSYGGRLALNQAHRGSDRLASVTLLDPGGLEKVGLRFFVCSYRIRRPAPKPLTSTGHGMADVEQGRVRARAPQVPS